MFSLRKSMSLENDRSKWNDMCKGVEHEWWSVGEFLQQNALLIWFVMCIHGQQFSTNFFPACNNEGVFSSWQQGVGLWTISSWMEVYNSLYIYSIYIDMYIQYLNDS